MDRLRELNAVLGKLSAVETNFITKRLIAINSGYIAEGLTAFTGGGYGMCYSSYTTPVSIATCVGLDDDCGSDVTAGPGRAGKLPVHVWYEQKDLTLFPQGYTPGSATTPTASPGSAVESSSVATANNTSPANNTDLNISSASDSGLSTGAKAGIGVGVAIFALLAFAIGSWLLLRRRRRQKRASEPQFERYTGKPELEAPNEKGPLHGVAELSATKSLTKTAQKERGVQTIRYELPESAQSRTSKELDSNHIYEASGTSKIEQPESSTKSSDKEDTTRKDTSIVPKATTFEGDPLAASRYNGAPTTIEDLELQYLENEERRIQARKAELLRERVNQS